MPRRITWKEAQAAARAAGFTLRATGWGDWRLNRKGAGEGSASYVDTPGDAMDNLRAELEWMARRNPTPAPATFPGGPAPAELRV